MQDPFQLTGMRIEVAITNQNADLGIPDAIRELGAQVLCESLDASAGSKPRIGDSYEPLDGFVAIFQLQAAPFTPASSSHARALEDLDILLGREASLLGEGASVLLITQRTDHKDENDRMEFAGDIALATGYARALARRLTARKIRVNCIRVPDAASVPVAATGKLGESELASPVLIGTTIFLLSRASRWITGQVITLDAARY